MVHSHRRTEKVFFWQLEMFDVCTTGGTAHIDMIFKFLPHTQYGLNTICLCRTLHTVVFDIDTSLAAVPVDYFGLCRKLAWIRSSSSMVNGQPHDFCLHRHPVSVNCLYHAWMVLSVGGSFVYFARNSCCAVTTDLLVIFQQTKRLLPQSSRFLTTYTRIT
jgi:hypothetical protein